MSLEKVDLNLLVYLDALLRENNVSRAADYVGISQPAMSNNLKRLRKLFHDPLLVRTAEGMGPTERAEEIRPIIRDLLLTVEKQIQSKRSFDAGTRRRVFRIMASDYTESTLIPRALRRIRAEGPNITLDIMTPSDVSFQDVERGKVDLVINRFDDLPQSFHQKTLWHDGFSCLMSEDNPIQDDFSLENYLISNHVWVSKTGMGVGVGIHPENIQKLGWVDEALSKLGRQRNITIFTRHYQAALLHTQDSDLIVTVPSKMAKLHARNSRCVLKKPPFIIPPLELKMAWSPLLHENLAHRWIRKIFTEVADSFE